MKLQNGGVIPPGEDALIGPIGCYWETHRMPEVSPKIKVRVKKVDASDPETRKKILKSLEQLQKSLDADEIARKGNGSVLDMRLD